MAGDARCTFGTRMPVDIHMLNEMIYREQKHFRNYKIYTPSFGSVPVTGKFYAKHDQFVPDEEATEETRQADEYCERVAQTRALGPHTKYPYPVTENHVYGWYTDPIYPLDRSDRRFYHPRRESEHTKIAVIIRASNPKDRK